MAKAILIEKLEEFDPEQIQWTRGSTRILSPKGEVIFSLENVEKPEPWSQTAIDIVASKYFRKKAVPGTGHENSVKQLVGRVVKVLGKLLPAENQANNKLFKESLQGLLLHQAGSFNSPVWFNLGLFDSYGITVDGEFWRWTNGKAERLEEGFQHPQCSACFIQSIGDSLESIYSLATNEARIFKFGSGTGTNFSKLRGSSELLAGGGTSSGLMGFLELLDRGAAVVKSGGTTRRAAKMVCLDIDHPEIEAFIDWKMHEEEKARTLLKAGYSGGMDGEAFRTVSGQNSNNSVRVTDSFMHGVLADEKLELTERLTGRILKKVSCSALFEKIAKSAWACADPGIQFHDTIQKWNTCAADAPIRASNPCSEFMFLDDTACNLASLNLAKFQNKSTGFNVAEFKKAVRAFFLAQELLVGFSSYPTSLIAENSFKYRPLGLGYTNLGAYLMSRGLAYDSDEARLWAAGISALLTGFAYQLSTEMAEAWGPFEKYHKNSQSMMHVMRLHEKALEQISGWEFEAEAKSVWADVLKQGGKFGFRNSQATAIAPTGTISFMMDCDTTGIEPEFSLVKTKTLSGGGQLQLLNGSVGPALQSLGYLPAEIETIQGYIRKSGTASEAPGLKKQHESVFACAMGSPGSSLVIPPKGHLKMLAAVQPFISGSISKTINLPQSSTVEDVKRIYHEAWSQGLKAVAIYRDHSKAAQPLQSLEFPPCALCGFETVLKAGCFQCENCGHSMGCA